MKACFLLNPTRVKNRWDWRETASRHAKRFGLDAALRRSGPQLPYSTERCLEQAVEEGCTRVVVVGGDGSLHRAINALSQNEKNEDGGRRGSGRHLQ